MPRQSPVPVQGSAGPLSTELCQETEGLENKHTSSSSSSFFVVAVVVVGVGVSLVGFKGRDPDAGLPARTPELERGIQSHIRHKNKTSATFIFCC